jgi:hypothetical protein
MWIKNEEGGMVNDKVNDVFIDIVDDLVIEAEPDSELAEGLQWIDAEAHERGITFYEMALNVLNKHMAEDKAAKWYKDRNENVD